MAIPARRCSRCSIPSRTTRFQDNYLEVPFDLSQVLFIATGNLLDPIPPALRDRMEIIQLPGYTQQEKIEIGQRFLVPKQMAAHGLKPKHIEITDEALVSLVQAYTKEAGVRNIEREIADVMRKVARQVAEGRKRKTIVDNRKLLEYLGPPRFEYGELESEDQTGAATGLVVTEVGGDVVAVEVTRMEGKEDFILTGQLGDVMRESARAALSWIRANAASLGISREVFEKNTLHIHVPAGAIPKDGPSAGITMATAMVSALTGIPVRKDIAMTGEITLRGRVLPIGGLKSKILAAHLAGARAVILPQKNEKDLRDIPDEIREADQADPCRLHGPGAGERAAAQAAAAQGAPAEIIDGDTRARRAPVGSPPGAATPRRAASLGPAESRATAARRHPRRPAVPWLQRRSAADWHLKDAEDDRSRAGSSQGLARKAHAAQHAHGIPRLLRDARRAPDRQPGRHQEGLPQAGAQAPSGRQQDGSGRRGALQGGQRGLRGPQRSREAQGSTTSLARTGRHTSAPAAPARRARPAPIRSPASAASRGAAGRRPLRVPRQPGGPGGLQRLLPDVLRRRIRRRTPARPARHADRRRRTSAERRAARSTSTTCWAALVRCGGTGRRQPPSGPTWISCCPRTASAPAVQRSPPRRRRGGGHPRGGGDRNRAPGPGR